VPSRMRAEIAEQPEALRRTSTPCCPRPERSRRWPGDQAGAVHRQGLLRQRRRVRPVPLLGPRRSPGLAGLALPGHRLPGRPRPHGRAGGGRLPVRRHRGDRRHPPVGPPLRRPDRRRHQRGRLPPHRGRRRRPHHPGGQRSSPSPPPRPTPPSWPPWPSSPCPWGGRRRRTGGAGPAGRRAGGAAEGAGGGGGHAGRRSRGGGARRAADRRPTPWSCPAGASPTRRRWSCR
jgi:hypothetical protein